MPDNLDDCDLDNLSFRMCERTLGVDFVVVGQVRNDEASGFGGQSLTVDELMTAAVLLNDCRDQLLGVIASQTGNTRAAVQREFYIRCVSTHSHGAAKWCREEPQ